MFTFDGLSSRRSWTCTFRREGGHRAPARSDVGLADKGTILTLSRAQCDSVMSSFRVSLGSSWSVSGPCTLSARPGSVEPHHGVHVSLSVCLSSTCNMQIFTPWVTHLRVLSLKSSVIGVCVCTCVIMFMTLYRDRMRSHVCAHVSCVQRRLFHREYAS